MYRPTNPVPIRENGVIIGAIARSRRVSGDDLPGWDSFVVTADGTDYEPTTHGCYGTPTEADAEVRAHYGLHVRLGSRPATANLT